MKPSAWSRAAIVTLAIALLAAGFAALGAGRFTWGPPEIPKAQGEALRSDTVVPGVKNLRALRYRERVTTAVVREPQNTWSNLGFLFVGVLIAVHDRRVLARFLGAALVGLGLASGLYHASLLPAWRTVDVAMMGWVIFALALLGLSSVWNSRPGSGPLFASNTTQVWLSVIGGGLAIIAAIFRNDVRVQGVKPFDSTYMTVGGVACVFVLLGVGVLLAAGKRVWARLGVLAVITAAAILCQLWDHPGFRFFQPDSPIQAHAAWHILMACAAALTYDLFMLLEGRPTLGSYVT